MNVGKTESMEKRVRGNASALRAQGVCVFLFFFLFVYATARGMRGSVRMPAEGDRRGRAVA